MFAKLFETPEGQVLVRLTSNSEDEPSCVFSFELDPQEEFGTIVDTALGFRDWDSAQVCFNSQDEHTTAKAARAIRADLGR